MKFLKENSYDIIRLYINQIGITIFSLLLYFSIGSIQDKALMFKLKIAISVFAILFYFALLYTISWDWGAKDKIRIDAGRLECKKYKGALMALIANVPNFILSIGAVIPMMLHLAQGNEVAFTVSNVFTLILRFSAAMYFGVLQAIFIFLEESVKIYNFYESLGYFVMPFFAIGVTHLGYIFGLKEFKIFKIRKTNK